MNINEWKYEVFEYGWEFAEWLDINAQGDNDKIEWEMYRTADPIIVRWREID